MNTASYVSFLISPLILTIIFLLILYKYHPKSWSNIIKAVFSGFIAVLFLLVAGLIMDQIWHGNLFNLRRMAFYVFIIVAFSAELGKMLPLRLYFYNKPGFKGPFESIRYSIIISLSYSMLAVILFAFDIVGTDVIKAPLLFLYTYPIANIFFGIVMGFFVGLGKMRKNLLIDESVALFGTAFFHGVFYFSLISSDIRLFFVTTIGFAVIGIMLLVKSMSFKVAKGQTE
jgi:RsiW-degrading membrane proteinase PrsW (M82 family)